jgi:GT2 family glycosyltransferase
MSFKVAVLSARAENLVPCVKAVLSRDPDITPDRILVVDDGARAVAQGALPGVTWLQGEKPFIYARNANIALRAADSDVILLNDDARLVTPFGLTLLAGQVQAQPEIGLCSAGVQGVVGNPNQLASGRAELRWESCMLAFVAVYVPRTTLAKLGPLDERFAGYGFEDNDYCVRVLDAGLKLAVWDGCEVDHGGALTSTFRSKPDIAGLFRQNQMAFQAKWGRSL